MLFRSRTEKPKISLRAGAGYGTHTTQIGDQLAVSALPGKKFRGRWRCALSGEDVRIGQGFVNALEPKIGGRLIGGVEKGVVYPDGQPLLTVSEKLSDKNGWSWVCIKIAVDELGLMLEEGYTEKDLTVIQSAVRVSPDPLIGLHPIARLQFVNGSLELRQIAMFDYQHGTSEDPVTKRRRHFFFPA